MVSTEVLELLSSHLWRHQQLFRTHKTSSSWCDLISGVPQGVMLSSLLFLCLSISLLLIFSMCFICTQMTFNFFLRSAPIILWRHRSQQQWFGNNREWIWAFRLSFNLSKCQSIIVGRPRMISRIDMSKLPAIVYNGFIVPISSAIKDLGLWIDSRLT